MVVTFLDRYQHGEHEQVWQELVALGEGVRTGSVYADSLAIVHEMMRRVRHNLEILIPRLVRVGYRFGYGWIQPPADADFGWEQRQSYRRLMQWAREQAPPLDISTDGEELITDYQHRLERLRQLSASQLLIEHTAQRIADLQAHPSVSKKLDEIESTIGTLPLSVRAWYELVGSVNFVGEHPKWFRLITGKDPGNEAYDQEGNVHPLYCLEPLYVYRLDEERQVRCYTQIIDGAPARECRLRLISNGERAYGQTGQDAFDYEIAIPSPTADGFLLHERHQITFVNYLRNCFRWGGFPGWEQRETYPEQDLSLLTKDLLPI